MISFSSLQLVGIPFFEAVSFFFSIFFSDASREAALCLFLSSFFYSVLFSYLGSVKLNLSSLS
jgi:hypothetical protein